MKIVEIRKFAFEDGHDVEFIPSDEEEGTVEVWVNGVYVDIVSSEHVPTKESALYFYSLHSTSLSERLQIVAPPISMADALQGSH